ncbi:MAG: histidinol-phosphatase [Bacillales bacterium]|nr:histidinol-phosphatase [Bacillales bacterium]
MIKNNYHTHTVRCGHAFGEDEEYVLEAIAMGLSELGFSDHIMLKDHPQPNIRGDYSLLDDYVNSINALKEKYKDRIKIYLGFEAEALPYYESYYRELLDSKKIDFLCLGNHLEIVDNQLKAFFSSAANKNDIIRYTKSLIRGMKTGLYKFVCHPDCFMGSYVKWDYTCQKCSRMIIKASKKYDVPLEFNFGGVRRGKKIYGDEYRFPYPYDKFWKMVKKYRCKIILGLDAHAPLDLSSLNNDAGYKMIKELNLEFVNKLEI